MAGLGLNEPSWGEGVVDITPPWASRWAGSTARRARSGGSRRFASRPRSGPWCFELGETPGGHLLARRGRRGRDMAARIRSEVARQTGIPAENVRVCATHTHSMPGFCYLRQWGAMPVEFMATVEKRTRRGGATGQGRPGARRSLAGQEPA